jgi:hypothetical protein
MPAAITFLAMRARKSPLYAGMIRLDTDEGWDSMMAAVEQVIDLIGLASQISGLASINQEQLLKQFRLNLRGSDIPTPATKSDE